MKLEYVPLLKTQRDLYDMPRNSERFKAYIATMVDEETKDMKLPLTAMNPMGKEHVKELLDELIAMDADTIAAETTAEAEKKLSDIEGEFKIALVLADDAGGGWTNRYATEFSRRFETEAYYKRGWLEVGLWTSEKPSIVEIRERVLTTIYRAAYIAQHGYAKTLGDMLTQEGYSMAAAGCTLPIIDDEDMSITREVIKANVDSKNQATIMVCLFGDEAAESLGYPPLGLAPNAGLAMALHDARINLSKEVNS